MEPSLTDLDKPRSATSQPLRCWNCRADLGEAPVCDQCGKIQPLGRDADYFSVLRLPRKLSIDLRALEAVFHERSRQFHPDMFRAASGRERMIALENSSLLNGAYRTLRDPFERAAYLLRLEEGDVAGGGAQAPGDLFEEILEIQELLAEFMSGDPEDGVLYRPQLASRRDTLQAEQDGRAHALTGSLFEQWDALQDSAEPAPEEKARLLREIRRVIDERAYLRRVLNSLNEALAPNSERIHGG